MLIQSDAIHLPYKSKTFHACVTSPPYWGLRKYAGEQGEEPLGLETTPERHIERMVEVFREVRRVLRDDGVCWLNYGDCFNAQQGKGFNANSGKGGEWKDARRNQPQGMPQGSLMLMPHRLAIALQDDGWIVRNDLVWFKRNPMPESVAGWRWERSKTKVGNRGRGGEDWRDNATDTPQQRHAPDGSFLQDAVYEYGDDYVLRKSSWRHTRAHEYVFQLTKGMGYYCNQEVVRVKHDQPWRGKGETEKWMTPDGIKGSGGRASDTMSGRGKRQYNPGGRNPRSVLDVPTAPYKGAHYATFPPKLIAPLIRASVPRRCCPECGQAWAPVVEKDFVGDNIGKRDDQPRHGIRGSGLSRPPAGAQYNGKVTDYRPTCECGVTEHKPGIVLDIFGGSGTTGMVAKQLMRRWVVMDISRPYLDEQAKVRTGSGTPANALDGLPMFEE